MKKLLGVVAVGILSAVGLCAEDLASDLTLETSVQFQSERVFRGRNEFHKTFTPQVKAGYPIYDGGNLYVGIDSVLCAESGPFNQVNPYLGVLWDVTELFTVDGGFKHHFYTSMPKETREKEKTERNSSEIHVGVIADVLLEPSLYCFYDFTRREVAIEGRVRYNFDLSQYAFSGLGVNLGAKVGFDQASKPYGFAYKSKHGKKSYGYYGINADLIYELNNNARAKVGVAYEGNSAKQESWVNASTPQQSGARNSIWVNASIDCSF
ncbi:MAG: hypothetical protein LBS22_03995 [Puniceicoccales bacterium]|jgi:hypothetical protein|nr:hypothetical protein [Puniceicoccales bacterium]